jgi:hypothetical protein
MKIKIFFAVAGFSFFLLHSAFAFEGRINAVITRGNQATPLLYTVGTNFVRVEMTATNWPNPVDILDRNSGELTLLFPNNRSFVHVKPVAENAPTPPGFPQMPGGASPGAPTPNTMPNMPPPGMGVQAPPMMPPPMMESLKLRDTGQQTNILGIACEQYELKQRGETMEIWATDQLFPFQSYVQNQPHRFGPRMIEEQWGDLLKAKKLFPVQAVLKFDNDAARLRFEVQSITAEKLTDEDAALFQTPPEYQEIQPLPF